MIAMDVLSGCVVSSCPVTRPGHPQHSSSPVSLKRSLGYVMPRGTAVLPGGHAIRPVRDGET
ncbi:hypothetical protein GCM10027294_34170 [Marinactinospora endophytica]